MRTMNVPLNVFFHHFVAFCQYLKPNVKGSKTIQHYLFVRYDAVANILIIFSAMKVFMLVCNFLDRDYHLYSYISE